MKTIRNKTYANWLVIYNVMRKEKHYDNETAKKLAHNVLNNMEADKGYGNRPANWFVDQILTAEEFANQY